MSPSLDWLVVNRLTKPHYISAAFTTESLARKCARERNEEMRTNRWIVRQRRKGELL